MKKLFLTMCFFFAGVCMSYGQAKISFDTMTHNFGTFTSDEPIKKCTFTFTNKGNKPLVINQATASCGCTMAKYTKTPIMPGEKGSISVTYNGKGKFFGHFKKSITVRAEAVPELTRLYIEGVMTDGEAKKK